jgi:hypothetical protein
MIIFIALLILFQIFSQQIFSQKLIDIDSIKAGKSYKFVMFDQNEITGKVLEIDSVRILIKSDDGYQKINKEDIFSASGNLIKRVYNGILSVRSGFTFLLNSKYMDKTKTLNGYNIGIELVTPVNEHSGIRFDLQYNRILRDRVNFGAGYYDNGDVNMFGISGDFLLGNFHTSSYFYYYLNMGAGFHVTNEDTRTEYNYNNEVMYEFNRNPDINLLLNFGGTAGIKLSKKFGAYFHIQLNTFSGDGGFLMFWRETNLPVSAGVSYFF